MPNFQSSDASRTNENVNRFRSAKVKVEVCMQNYANGWNLNDVLVVLTMEVEQ